jgi:hypothetical protein
VDTSFIRQQELVHAICLLDAPEDEVANVEGSFLNIAVMITLKLLVVTGLSHDNIRSLFFEAVKVDVACLLGLSFLIELDVWSSKGDIGGYHIFRSVDQKEGRKTSGGADLGP